MKTLPGKITISRLQGNRDSVIQVTLIDVNSTAHFVTAELTPEDFALAITGLGHCPCSLEVQGLDALGLVRESKPLVFACDHEDVSGNPRDHATSVCQSHADEGWTAVPYFRSQNSIRQSPEKYIFHTQQHRFVQPTEAKDQT